MQVPSSPLTVHKWAVLGNLAHTGILAQPFGRKTKPLCIFESESGKENLFKIGLGVEGLETGLTPLEKPRLDHFPVNVEFSFVDFVRDLEVDESRNTPHVVNVYLEELLREVDIQVHWTQRRDCPAVPKTRLIDSGRVKSWVSILLVVCPTGGDRLVALDLSLGTAGVVTICLALMIRLVQGTQHDLDRDHSDPGVFDVRFIWLKATNNVHVSEKCCPVRTGGESSPKYLELDTLQLHRPALGNDDGSVCIWVEEYWCHHQTSQTKAVLLWSGWWKSEVEVIAKSRLVDELRRDWNG